MKKLHKRLVRKFESTPTQLVPGSGTSFEQKSDVLRAIGLPSFRALTDEYELFAEVVTSLIYDGTYIDPVKARPEQAGAVEIQTVVINRLQQLCKSTDIRAYLKFRV